MWLYKYSDDHGQDVVKTYKKCNMAKSVINFIPVWGCYFEEKSVT